MSWLWLSMVLLAGAAPLAGAPARPDTPAASAQPKQGDTAAGTAVVTDYVIVPGDVLKISVWKEPELSVEASVRLDGRITVPLLGDLPAAGRTPNDLSAEIQTKLGRFLEVPQVTLAVSQAVSARFYVLGEVAHAAAYPLPSRITALQALALAGGFREFAKKDSILIIRHKGAQQVAIPLNYKDLESGLRLEQNIFLESGDTILVP
jgi:polysaccharide export outer membrane protein